MTTPTSFRTGVNVTVTINRNRTQTIAKQFAGKRDAAQLELYLRHRLKISGQEEIQVNIEDLLHPIIQKSLGTFASISGPNCFHAGLCVNNIASPEPKHVTASELLEQLYANYRFVRPHEVLRTGDVLVYLKASKAFGPGALEHVGTFITDDLVLAKNGLNRFSPYIFQDKAENEFIYFPDGDFKMMAFRIPSPNEKVVSRRGNYNGIDPVYYTAASELVEEANPVWRTYMVARSALVKARRFTHLTAKKAAAYLRLQAHRLRKLQVRMCAKMLSRDP